MQMQLPDYFLFLSRPFQRQEGGRQHGIVSHEWIRIYGSRLAIRCRVIANHLGKKLTLLMTMNWNLKTYPYRQIR